MVDLPQIEQLPPTVWGLFAFMTISMLSLLTWFVRGIKADQVKITEVLDNHLSTIGTNLVLMESRLDTSDRRAETYLPVFLGIRDNLEFIKSAIVQSTIVPPGTKASVEPVTAASVAKDQKNLEGMKPEE